MRLPLVLLTAAAFLAACTAPVTSEDACGAEDFRDRVGLPVDGIDLPQDRPVRVIRPGDAVTMDYLETRLNVSVDAEGRVVSLRCG